MYYFSFHIHHALISKELHVLKFRSGSFEIHVQQVFVHFGNQALKCKVIHPNHNMSCINAIHTKLVNRQRLVIISPENRVQIL